MEVDSQVRLTTVDLEGSEEGTLTAVEAVRSGQTLTLDGEDADPEAPGYQVRLSDTRRHAGVRPRRI